MRSDRFACFQPQPNPGGVWLIQYGGYNYTSMRPADQAGDCDGVTSAIGATAAVGEQRLQHRRSGSVAGGAVVVLAVAGGVVLMRRRATVGERE